MAHSEIQVKAPLVISNWVIGLLGLLSLLSPGERSSTWSSFHTPQGAAHFILGILGDGILGDVGSNAT